MTTEWEKNIFIKVDQQIYTQKFVSHNVLYISCSLADSRPELPYTFLALKSFEHYRSKPLGTHAQPHSLHVSLRRS